MKKYGFTLIELLVVTVIIGILASISITQFNQYQTKARDARTEAQVKQIYTLIEADMILRETNKYYQEYVSGADGTERIVQAIYDSGGSLPDPSQSCYLIVILDMYNNTTVRNTDESGIAVIAPRDGLDLSQTIPVSDKDFDKYMIASGSARVLNMLKNESEYPPSPTFSWAGRVAVNMNQYVQQGCKRMTEWSWNGMGVRPAPYYHLLNVVPLDPSYAEN